MKLIGLSIFVLIFVVTPYLLLQSVVLPALDEMKYTYQNMDTISQAAVNH